MVRAVSGPGPLSFENIPRAGPKIGTLGTLRGSHGTKTFFSKIFSYKVNEVYVVRFGFFRQKFDFLG